jgi:negative regulator of sigma E activity
MLLDRYRQLLTAYVDGELSSRQRRHVVRLLHRSAEARQLLEQLQSDARALRQLPSLPLPADLTGPVLQLITERNLAPRPPRIVKTASIAWFGPLASLAAAAAVLLTIGVASYLYFVASLDQQAKTATAQTQPNGGGSTPPSENPEPAIAHKNNEIVAEPRKSPTSKIDRRAVEPPKSVRKSDEKTKPSSADKPSPSLKGEAALADRLETFHFDRVPDLLPVIAKLSDLDRQSARKDLVAALSKDNAFRLELPCSNGTKAFDRVQNAARTLRLSFIIDKQAQERLKLKWKISYAVYLENITPEELTEFIHQVYVADRKSAGGKATEVQLDRLVLTHMNAANRKELSTLLGVDPLATGPNANGSSGTDPRNDLTDSTARQVGQSLAGQGGAARPESGKSARPAENIALVLAYNPVRPSPGSDEIKHFLDSRKPARPGTIRVLLVLRNG